ncbi:MAG TPA: SDR family oxidoreductase [Gemmatimonadales bacterium]|nr:SDR family oxidoreductase [Gemmatimonadales bacterium]
MSFRPSRSTLLAAGAVGAWLALRARRERYDLRGRTVLVTGGSRGLGLALARALVREGARVAICGRDTATLERARIELERPDASVLAIPCDVTDPVQVEAMLQIVREWFGPLDVLVNDAGTIVVAPEQALTLADYDDAMRTNFFGVLHTTRAALPDLRRRPGSRIVNISSIGGVVGVPHLAPYVASKFAVTGYSLTLRAELAAAGVVVTTICPGLMRTGSPPNALFKGRHKAEYAWFSISDSLPGVTVSAEAAAERILRACRRGEALVVFPWHMRAAQLLQAVAPGVLTGLLGAANRVLPGYAGAPNRRMTGWQSRSVLSPSWLTTLGDRATRRLNQSGDQAALASAGPAAASDASTEPSAFIAGVPSWRDNSTTLPASPTR